MDNEEKEILSVYTGLAICDDFFCGQQSVSEEDLMPAFNSLLKQCDGMIKECGIYAIRLQIVKIK